MSRVAYNHPAAVYLCSKKIYEILQTLPSHDQLTCVCIGTDRSTGDSLGPLVGSLLSKKTLPGVTIRGTLEKPVHAMNLLETIEQINKQQPVPTVLAIDACLGKSKSVGLIQMGLGPIKPGAGVNKNLPSIGQVHITGVVNVSGLMEYFVLQNTRLSIVMKMAEVISTSLHLALEQIYDKKTTI